jgi:hypothetical protein
MIPVSLPPEPAGFDRAVRQEGLAHLREQGQDPAQPPANASLWKLRRMDAYGKEGTVQYWQRAREDLRISYSNRCVYSCFVIETECLADGREESSHSIDHFEPKSRVAASRAYDWDNLRWAWRVIDNEGKRDHWIPPDHDPTALRAPVFQLVEDDRGHWLVVPDPSLEVSEQTRLNETIRLLGLNLRKVVLRRNAYVDDFLTNGSEYGVDWMQERQPFVYRELRRIFRVWAAELESASP